MLFLSRKDFLIDSGITPVRGTSARTAILASSKYFDNYCVVVIFSKFEQELNKRVSICESMEKTLLSAFMLCDFMIVAVLSIQCSELILSESVYSCIGNY
jgi:hypothetical protein